MTTGKLHPADEKLVEDVAEYIRRTAPAVRIGGVLTVKIGRGNNSRLTFHSADVMDSNPIATLESETA
jgi:hypothetical protein